jgi:ribosomal protein S18 acetylase RimI-like enzyme
MKHTIVPASPNDLPRIYNLFEEAIRFQKDNHYIGWNNYDSDFIRADVDQGLLFKIVNENADVLAIFCICYTDKLIWRNREQGDALYLHRIVLNRVFQGMKIFNTVLKWAIVHASTLRKKFVRMDTWAENHKLIDYYKGYGFQVIELYTTSDTPALPIQHRNLHVALLEYAV